MLLKGLLPKSIFRAAFECLWLPLVLAVISFFVYWPSLASDLVYDARTEIVKEGYISSLANLPDVLTLHVLSMKLMVGARPGQLLYLMLNAAVWGNKALGYHLSSNLLHAANVALLFVLLRRLIGSEMSGDRLKVQLALVAVSLIFALHPIATESVASVSYSSDLLVTFFTLLALLATTAFRPDDFRVALLMGSAGTLCAFAAMTCKESGLAACLVLIAYWFFFRRGEAVRPWLLFLGAAIAVTAIFLVARFTLAPPPSNSDPIHYLGGSFTQVFSIQPRLWVYMMGQVLWPVHLSADYTVENVSGVTLPVALVILVAVVLLQVWLATKSRVGALGVAIYWLGLVTVSNFVPLYRIMADRFYYLPLVGVTMQLLAFLLILRSRPEFWMVLACCFFALLPATLLTLLRQQVFATDASLWSDTIEVSPYSSLAHYNIGNEFLHKGKLDEAWAEYQKSLAINPEYASPYNTLGVILAQKGRTEEAVMQFDKALELRPDFAEPHGNLGIVFAQKGDFDQAINEFQKDLEINPGDANSRINIGQVYLQKDRVNEAIAQFQAALQLEPDNQMAKDNLAKAERMAVQKMGPIK